MLKNKILQSSISGLLCLYLLLASSPADDRPPSSCDGLVSFPRVLKLASAQSLAECSVSACGSNQSLEACMAGAYSLNNNDAFGGEYDLSKWYVAVLVGGICLDGSTFQRTYSTANGALTIGYLNNNQDRVVLSFSSPSSMDNNTTLTIVIREPCSEVGGSLFGGPCPDCDKQRISYQFFGQKTFTNMSISESIPLDQVFVNACGC